MRLSAALVLLLGACSDDARAVRIAGGPQLAVEEGQLLRATLGVDPPDGPLDPANFAIEVAPGLATHFRRLRVEEDAAGEVRLVVQPDCGLVTEAGPALVPLTVRTEPRERAVAAEATLLVQLAPESAPCLPSGRAWFVESGGTCADEPAESAIINLDRGQAGKVCMRFRSYDPADPVMLTLESTLPASAATLPEVPASQLFLDETFEALLSGDPDVVGSFAIRWTLEEASTTRTSGEFRISIGTFGTDVGVEAGGGPADEFDVTRVTVRVYPFVGPARPCVLTARRLAAPGLPRRKPFLRLYDPIGQRYEEGDAVPCREGPFTLAVSPPIDAEAVERVTLEVFLEETVPRGVGEATFEVQSHADELACGADDGAPAVLACADLDGDPTPEVVVARAASCVHHGAGGRVDRSIAPAPEAAQEMLSFVYAGRAVVLGRVASGLAELAIDVAAGTAGWTSPAALGLDPADAIAPARAVPLAASSTAPVTHLAHLPAGAAAVAIRTLGSSAESVTPLGLPGTPAGIALVGLDADDDHDLLVAYRDGGDLALAAIELAWPGPTVQRVVPLPPLAGAPAFSAAGGPTVIVATGAPDDARLHLICPSCASPAWETRPAPGAVRRVLGRDGEVLVALGTGLWRHDPAAATWTVADPVIAEDALLGNVTLPQAAYGQELVGCAGSPGHAVVRSGGGSVRLTELEVSVGLP